MTIYHQAPTPMTGREDPEDGPLAKRVYHYVAEEGARAMLGFACEAGVRRNKGRTGAKAGPAAIRKSLSGLAAPVGFMPVVDLGDVVVDGDDLEEGQLVLGQHVDAALRAHERVIVFGGGHETAYGNYLGLKAAYPDQTIGIINLDAHLDLRNIGELGASSGTPFNQIRNLNPDAFDYLCIGAARESNTQALFARACDWGVGIVFDRALGVDPACADADIEAMAKRCDLIYLTVDIDLLPHYQAPGVSAPAARGVPLIVVERIIDTVLRACQGNDCVLPLVDFVELSPAHDRDDMTAKSAAILALKVLCR